MVLQNPDTATGKSRLKRVLLIGDHHQLPPVVKNLAFQKYSRLDQSLFARLVRLGVPATQLDFQGRARPAIANLYRWRYTSLGDLPGVLTPDGPHALAVPGFLHDFQLVHVADPQGVGESTPLPHYVQVDASEDTSETLAPRDSAQRALAHSPSSPPSSDSGSGH